MTIAAVAREDSSRRFPKSARLLKRQDFRFRPYQRFQTESFVFFYTSNGSGRLGISIAKKVLRSAVARNRVRRLLRETFRLNFEVLHGIDVHVVGAPSLSNTWSSLRQPDVQAQFSSFLSRLSPHLA